MKFLSPWSSYPHSSQCLYQLLFSTRYSLSSFHHFFVTESILFMFMFISCISLFVVCYLLFIIIYYLLFIIYYLLFIIYYLLFIIYYLFIHIDKIDENNDMPDSIDSAPSPRGCNRFHYRQNGMATTSF